MSASVNRGWIVDLVQRLPAGAMSRAWGFLVRRRHPRAAVSVAKRLFARASGMDLSEAASPIGTYDSLEELFIRRLRPGVRRVDPSPVAVVSPVDAVVGACGTVEDGTLLQVKGRSYSLGRLLDDEDEAVRYEGGPYATFYLSPKDYHRIHTPVTGVVREARIVPGRLLPVFQESVDRIDELFAKNERLITYLDTTEAGRLAVVKVGATMVGRIGVTYDLTARTNVPGGRTRHLRYDPGHALSKGEELGVFELGSTVVLMGERGRVSFDALVPGEAVRVGSRIGTLLARLPEARGRTAKAAAAPAPQPRPKGAGGKKRSRKARA
jgi:phosphatidylserine decarboxylase